MAGLLPADPDPRDRSVAWMFAALATVEPPIVERSMTLLFDREKSWFDDRLPVLEDRVRTRLGDLAARLGDSEWLDGGFSAGDLMMIAILRRLQGSGRRKRRTWLPMSRAARPARPSGAPSRRNSRRNSRHPWTQGDRVCKPTLSYMPV